ncbi:hypothetical protein LXA43DRAFT_1091493 [Ganoderma leucocontextum]|nr:hypothetical protein LXA43DRAFT_1091493 [Ganoderma leucocontextum]
MAVGVAALIGYDYLLTVRQESRLFWKRRVNAASILFFANRYLSLFYYAQYYVDTGMRYLQYLPWAAFSALRVYALSQRSWFLSAFTFIWAVLAFPLDYYGDFHHTSFVDDPVLGCTSGATTPSFLSLLGPYFHPPACTIFIRGGQIIADAVVIGVTWKATYHARSEGSMSFLTRVMFRNGTMYFIILLALNISTPCPSSSR